MLDVAGEDKLARDLVAGGVFVSGYDLPLNEECELVLRGANDAEVRVAAHVVWVGNGGIGLQLHNCDAEMKQRITNLVAGGAVEAAHPELSDASVESSDAPEATDDKQRAPNMHERLRNLTLAQQVKLAHGGELAERILLERLYGKNVWEPLLRNARITGPEVARIARMGALPRPLMEIILNNGGWLQIPEVRRALLTNPRLGTDQIMRILRLLPKHEIKIAATQTVYPLAVRDAAKRLMKELGS
jgi:hypothetical protein